jgi:hypothetical protein
MPVIYLKHERHGTKVACSEGEAVYDEAQGWKRFDPMAAAQERTTASAPASIGDGTVEPVKPKNKGGRPRKVQ